MTLYSKPLVFLIKIMEEDTFFVSSKDLVPEKGISRIGHQLIIKVDMLLRLRRNQISSSTKSVHEADFAQRFMVSLEEISSDQFA